MAVDPYGTSLLLVFAPGIFYHWTYNSTSNNYGFKHNILFVSKISTGVR